MSLEGILIITTLIYLVLMGYMVYGFDQIEDFKLTDLKASTKFSIIIPFRNEANNLLVLLKSITELKYPTSHFEVLLINDDSNDSSVEIIQNYLENLDPNLGLNIKVLSNIGFSNSPKKDAITLGVNKASNSWIITTDADCMLPPYWLDAFDEKIQSSDSISIIGPVALINEPSFLNKFQILEVLGLQGSTIGSFGMKKPLMCNGANFSYQKSVFLDCQGYKGNNDIASGDDLFLLEKFLNYSKDQVHYLKCKKAIVSTRGEANLKSVISQRIRWASKTSNFGEWFTKLVGLIVFLVNLSLITILPLILSNMMSLTIGFALIIIKLGIDFLMVFKASRFFNQENVLLYFLFSGILYPVFSILIVFLSIILPYRWKGRTFKK